MKSEKDRTDKMILYHGSRVIVEKPIYGYGKKTNDYGQGFYCTENAELAREWACPGKANGFCNEYELLTEGLEIVHLNGQEYNILNWLAILLKNRTVNLKAPVEQAAGQYILKNYSLDFSDADVLIGYRADDRYFSYVRSFLSNTITVGQLAEAMHLGKLGEQVFLHSEKAFSCISFLGAETVDGKIYSQKRKKRAEQADQEYSRILEQTGINGIFAADILRGMVTEEQLKQEMQKDWIV